MKADSDESAMNSQPIFEESSSLQCRFTYIPSSVQLLTRPYSQHLASVEATLVHVAQFHCKLL
jgi:hypothetical protein